MAKDRREDESKSAAAGQVPPPEPEPKAVPLVKPGKDEAGVPGAPQADPAGAVPRFVHENERAPKPGFSRFKVGCSNYLPQPTRYVLAGEGDAQAAKDYYLEATRLRHLIERLRAAGGPEPEPAYLTVKELPD